MNSTILVITGEAAWTRRAVHLASAMARDAGARDATGELRIIRLLPVARLEDLGAGAREELLPFSEYEALAEWVATAENYGVAVSLEFFEYTDYTGALLSAAEQIEPRVIFAPPPGGRLAIIGRIREWLLRRQLRRPLFTLGEGDGPPAWTETPGEPQTATSPAPSVSMKHP